MLHLCTVQNKCLLLETAARLQTTQQNFPFGVTLSQVIPELLAAKRAGNRRPDYVKSLSHYLERFAAGRASAMIASVTTAEIETWLAQFPVPESRKTWLNRLSTLFAFAVRRDYLAVNPCDKIERVTIDRKPPVIFTPGQSRQLLALCPTICRPWLVLTMFAGIRPDREMRFLRWEHVGLDTGTVQILFPKVRKHRRIVPLEPVAVQLLREHPLKAGNVAPSNSTLRRFKRRMRTVLGLSRWPQDVTRHTAASYLLAKHQDAGKVSAWLGNSPSVLMTHYVVPVEKAACDDFWRDAAPVTERGPVTAGQSQVLDPAQLEITLPNGRWCQSDALGCDMSDVSKTAR